MNPRLAPAEVGHMLAHSGASAVVADGELVSQDRSVANTELTFVVDVKDSGDVLASESGPRVISWAEIVSGDRNAFQVPRTEDDLADILLHLGTTGRPKGVAVRHSNASMVGDVDPTYGGAGWLHASPMFTFAGIALVYTPMKLGLRGIYLPKLDADRRLDVVETEKPMAIFLVPAMAHLLLDNPRFDSVDLSSVAMCSVGMRHWPPSWSNASKSGCPTPWCRTTTA